MCSQNDNLLCGVGSSNRKKNHQLNGGQQNTHDVHCYVYTTYYVTTMLHSALYVSKAREQSKNQTRWTEQIKAG